MTTKISKFLLSFLAIAVTAFSFAGFASAQTSGSLKVSPATGVYTAGGVFTVRVQVNTSGQAINAAEGTLSYDASQISVVAINDAGSIFNLWVDEPKFNNSAGTINFAGGTTDRSGYTGGSGQIFSVTFRAVKEATANLRFTSGTITAHDGKGTNIIGSMNGGTYTIGSAATLPPPEIIVPDNSPAAPKVSSPTHPDPNKWYTEDTIEFEWNVPSDVTNVRLTADQSANTVPAVFYDTPISGKVLEEWEEGAWYLHVQQRNADGWGRITHFPFNIDYTKPESLTITQVLDTEGENPRMGFEFIAVDEVSGVNDYEIQIDGGDIISWTDDGSHTYYPELLAPGEHVMVVRGLDGAGNAIVESITFTVASLDVPVITDYPETLNSGNVLTLRGVALPDSVVTIYIEKKGDDPRPFEVVAGEDGSFTFVMDEIPDDGFYKIWATATDKFGATSDPSPELTIAVQTSGLLKLGGIAISWLSVVVPLVALVILLALLLGYIIRSIIGFKKRIGKEVTEAEEVLHQAVTDLHFEISEHVKKLESARKRRALTKEEDKMVKSLNKKLDEAEEIVKKEIRDIRKVK